MNQLIKHNKGDDKSKADPEQAQEYLNHLQKKEKLESEAEETENSEYIEAKLNAE